jgi:hypothetical protein
MAKHTVEKANILQLDERGSWQWNGAKCGKVRVLFFAACDSCERSIGERQGDLRQTLLNIFNSMSLILEVCGYSNKKEVSKLDYKQHVYQIDCNA